ncbi:DUF6493 family protein [Streptomyces sp. CWNU-52B]|uniref:DUF6493 family protein n=1 Tax=unclassified Streptomyces TaxID=2593676 RepID=UPI0039C1F5E4
MTEHTDSRTRSRSSAVGGSDGGRAHHDDDEDDTKKLIARVRAGDVPGVVRELRALTPARRKACAAGLKGHREAVARQGLTAQEKAALFAAELGCQVTPEATTAWLLSYRYFKLDTWTVDVLNLYPVAWRAELVARLDDRATSSDTVYTLTEHLVHDTGCPLPTSQKFVLAWLFNRANNRERPTRVLGGAPGADLLARLRADVLAPRLLPVVVARPGHFVLDRPAWVLEALLGLAAEGAVDRAELVRNLFADMAAQSPHPVQGARATQAGAVLEALALTPAEHAGVAPERAALVGDHLGRLLDDGTRVETAPSLSFLRALDATPAENAPLAREYVALLDGSLPVATYAQEVLTGLDEAGLLEPGLRTEACERVLLRPEKKLVRAQLMWLDKAVRRDPSRAARTLADVAIAFEHRDMALQERALAVIGRHLKAADESALPGLPELSGLRAELRSAAARLTPGLAARAAELFGAPEGLATERPYADTLPRVPEPSPVPDPLASPAEVAEEVAAVVADDQDVVAFERALDGLVRHAHLDRRALAESLKPVMRKEPKGTVDWVQGDLYDVARAVRGDEPRSRVGLLHRAVHLSGIRPSGGYSLAGSMLAARLAEAMAVIESGTQPFLLAVPTLSTGALDAAVLLERITALDALGVTPAPVDLAQALLRVTPSADDQVGRQVIGAAEALTSDAGRRLAHWLREGGLAHQDSEPTGWPHRKPPKPASQGWWTPVRPGAAIDPAFPPVAAALIGPYEGNNGLADPIRPFWVAQLPHHREELMARDYFEPRMSQKGWPSVLPRVAESGGPAGYSVHLAAAFGLIWRLDPDAVVDALLVLAARGQLDTDLLGRQLEALLNHGWPGANRAADTLRTAAETGAYATVWSVLRSALPGLLHDTPVRGVGELLALAVECVSRCGAKGELPEVTATAARTGSSRLVKNAGLLRDALR